MSEVVPQFTGIFSFSIVSMEVEDKSIWGFSSNQVSIPSLGHLHEMVGVHTNGLRG